MKPLTPISYQIEQLDIVKYAGASGDFNELHVVVQSAVERGFGNSIAHGMYIMGLATNTIMKWLPEARLKSFKVRFQASIYPGD